MTSQMVKTSDLEWWMHYMIPMETLHLYYDANYEVRQSQIAPSKRFPDQDPGKGLFTTVDRFKGDFLCSFPGYWMAADVFPTWMDTVQDSESYGFQIKQPDIKDGWPEMPDLVYVSHVCLANRINAGKINDEVHVHTRVGVSSNDEHTKLQYHPSS